MLAVAIRVQQAWGGLGREIKLADQGRDHA